MYQLVVILASYNNEKIHNQLSINWDTYLAKVFYNLCFSHFLWKCSTTAIKVKSTMLMFWLTQYI